MPDEERLKSVMRALAIADDKRASLTLEAEDSGQEQGQGELGTHRCDVIRGNHTRAPGASAQSPMRKQPLTVSPWRTGHPINAKRT